MALFFIKLMRIIQNIRMIYLSTSLNLTSNLWCIAWGSFAHFSYFFFVFRFKYASSVQSNKVNRFIENRAAIPIYTYLHVYKLFTNNNGSNPILLNILSIISYYLLFSNFRFSLRNWLNRNIIQFKQQNIGKYSYFSRFSVASIYYSVTRIQSVAIKWKYLLAKTNKSSTNGKLFM